jgi:hypothetical protein
MAILTEPEPVRVWPLLMERLTTDLPVDLAVLIDLDWDVGTGHALTGKPDWLHEAPLDALINAHMRVHPLLRHYARTADRTPLALDEIADDRWWKSEAYRAGKSAIGIDRQLALPLSSRPRQVRGVIMSRSGHGFTDRDVLPTQPEDLLDHVGRRGMRRVVWSAGAVLEALQALGFVASAPGVEALAADAVVAAGGGDVAAHLFRVTQHCEPMAGASCELAFSHEGLLGTGDPPVNNVRQF